MTLYYIVWSHRNGVNTEFIRSELANLFDHLEPEDILKKLDTGYVGSEDNDFIEDYGEVPKESEVCYADEEGTCQIIAG